MPTKEKNGRESVTTANLTWSKVDIGKKSSLAETVSSSEVEVDKNILPPPIAKCGTMESPYDAAVVRNWDAKLFSNKVYNSWYRRYVNTVPENMQFQPFDEIQRREAGIALQYYLGPSYRILENPEDQWSIKQKDTYIRRYSKVKQSEEEKRFKKTTEEPDEVMRVLSLRSILAAKKAKDLAMKEMFGMSTQDRHKTESVCKLFFHLRNARKRKSIAQRRLKPNSKWHILKDPAVRERMRLTYRAYVKSQARTRFVKIMHTVFHIRNFIFVVSKLAGDTHSVFSGLKHLKAEREKLLDRSHQADLSRIKKFNPASYTFNKEVILPPKIKLSLTMPCGQRTMEEVDKIVETLQQIRSFVAYPIAYQRVIAKSAWYIVVPAFRVVIRERHEAVSYYFMISGRANVQKLVGSSHHLEASQFKQIRVLRAQDMFGEEAVTTPGCRRSYTVTTDTACELLSINCSELQDSMLITTSSFETAPEHIRFLGSLNAMRKFPKLKLLEEGQENINIAHFLGGAVVTTDVEKSDYVYFVYYGTCDVLREIPPPQSVVDKYTRSKRLRETFPTRGSVSPVPRKSVAIQDAMRQDTVIPSALQLDKPTDRRSYFASGREYIETRENLRNVLMKEIEKRQNDYISYRNAFMAEARELEDKCRQIAKTMPTKARERILGGQIVSPRPPIPDNPPTYVFKSSRPKDSSSNSNVDQTKDKQEDDKDTFRKMVKIESASPSQDVVNDDSRKRMPSIVVTSRRSSRFSSGEMSVEFLSGKDDTDDSRKQKSSLAVPGGRTSRLNSNVEFLSDKDDKDENRLRTSHRLSKLVGSNMNLMDAVFRPSYQQEAAEAKSVTDSGRASPRRQSIDGHRRLSSQMAKFSKWAMVRTAIRGDVVGTEFLDFRSGPFEPPKEVWSIVTPGGATVIMVKKSFLLTYLRKQW